MVKEITVKASDIPRGERKIIDVDGISIAVFSIADKFYAIDSACPHQGGPLGNGELVDGATIVCPFHAWSFDVKTGINTKFDSIKIKSFPVKVDGDEIKITIE